MASKEIAKSRAAILQKIRDFFAQEKFTEVETPILTPFPGMEPHLTPFETKFKFPLNFKTIPGDNSTWKVPLYLNTSPELQMKKLLAAKLGNIFQITKVFRNQEIGGPLHNPEFTMLEWYREKANYKDLMKDCEKLILSLLRREKKISHQNHNIDFSTPWPRKSVNELFVHYCKIDLLKNRTVLKLKKSAEKQKYDTKGCNDWDDLFFKIFLNEIEPKLPKNRPLFIYDYPASQAALAKINSKQPFFAERFELYIGGIEIANAFSELIDPQEQLKRLKEEQKLRKKLKKTVFPIDQEFLKSLEKIKNPCAGIALGIDRLIMLLLDKKSIDDVLLFPMTAMLKP